MIKKTIYQCGIKKRNPSLIPYLDFLNTSESWSLEDLEKYQFQKCKALLEFAYLYSPYYKKLFRNISFNPSLMTGLYDLNKIPIIEKKELISRTQDIHTIFKFNKLLLSETSGTSGQVLKFYRNEEWDSGHRAAMYRGYSWYDINPWDKNGYLWGYNIRRSKVIKTRILDYLQNRFRIFSYNEKEIVWFAKKLEDAIYLHGYSSMIYEIAKIINQIGLSGKYKLKMIKGTSEKIYENYQVEVIKAFGTPIISEYGATEAGIIAYECPQGSMHINMENVIVQEERGDIIITNLLSKSFPIIRYKLGDSIILAPSDYKCVCGRSHKIIFDVVGRIGKKIEGKFHSYPSLTLYYVFKNIALTNNIVLNYQAIQKEKGKIKLLIEQNESNYEKYILHELETYYNNDLEFEILFGQKLHKMEGKLKDFVSELN